MAATKSYLEKKDLQLTYTLKDNKGDLDDDGAKKFKRKATVSGSIITDLQTDLVALGYLQKAFVNGFYGGESARAVLRFQRHAARVYRIVGSSKKSDDVPPADVFKGSANGICDSNTASEIGKWIEKGWINPVGRFKTVALPQGGKLREDAAVEWAKIVQLVVEKGGTLEGPYGDTLRVLEKMAKEGTSQFSLHYFGRAVDINQDFASNWPPTYCLLKEPSGEKMYWRILCRTVKQDGTQGTFLKAGEKTCFAAFNETEYKIPKGYYIDLTELILSTEAFERIPARPAWKTAKARKDRYNSLEWWHFQYQVDVQETFLDELELVGYDEQTVRNSGWKKDVELDYKLRD